MSHVYKEDGRYISNRPPPRHPIARSTATVRLVPELDPETWPTTSEGRRLAPVHIYTSEVKTVPVYHWSPRTRRSSIEQHGLQPGSAPTRTPMPDGFTDDAIYVGTTVGLAWTLCGAIHPKPGLWDLYEVQLSPQDQVMVVKEYQEGIRDIALQNGIPTDRLFWVGERELKPDEVTPAQWYTDRPMTRPTPQSRGSAEVSPIGCGALGPSSSLSAASRPGARSPSASH
jgi:hypothetical protein